MRFSGQTVVVSGASRGIGRACALAFGREGANVVVLYRESAEAASEVVDRIGESGGAAEAHAVDLRDSAAVTGLVAEVAQRLGRIDVLVNNAGIARDALLPMMDDSEWGDVLAVNLGGAFHLARAVSRPMMLQKRGRIINLSSVAATKGGRGQTNYAASKAALEGLTRSLAVELAPRGILVNAVAPGVVVTDMSARIREQGEAEALSKILLERFAEPEEIAAVVCFLASDAASYITGAVIPVDGGFKLD